MANAREERIKLTANYFNGLAIALAAIGGFAPMISGTVTPAKVVICFVISFALHYAGHLTLRRLGP
jgi:hypothetical protein